MHLSSGQTPSQSRRRLGFGITALLVVLICAGCGSGHAKTGQGSQTKTTSPPQETTGTSTTLAGLGITGKFHLVLNSGFQGTTIDSNIWSTGWFGTGVTGPINTTEEACYSSGDAVEHPGGALDLALSATHSSCSGNSEPYTGSVLSSNPHDGRSSGGFEYTYGVLQARVYLPGTRNGEIANWPSLLTLGQHWPMDGEDDVFEGLNGKLCSHFHSPGHAVGAGLGTCVTSIKPGWHTFTANWERGSMTWYYDTTELDHISEGITSSPMYIVLANTAWSHAKSVIDPGVLKVSYIKVWQEDA